MELAIYLIDRELSSSSKITTAPIKCNTVIGILFLSSEITNKNQKV